MLTLVFLDKDGRELMTRNTTAVSGSTDWVRVYPSEPAVAPRDAVSALVRCRLTGMGKAWYDDILLHQEWKSIADLELTKTAWPTTARAGELLTYTLIYNNVGNALVQYVTVTDTLPLSVSVIHASPPASTQPDPRTLVWNVGALEGNSTPGVITVVVAVDDTLVNGQLLSNTSTIAGTTSGKAISETAIVTTEVIPLPKLEVLKTPSNEAAQAGDILSYTLLYRNVGGETAADVTLTDTLPISVILESSSPPADRTPDPHTLVWELGNISQEGTGTITITVTISSSAQGQELCNHAVIKNPESSDSGTACIGVYSSHTYTTSLPLVTRHLHLPCADPIGDLCGGADSYEPNNTFCSATPLTTSSSIQALLCCTDNTDGEGYADDDIYFVDIESPGVLAIDLTELPDGQDYDLYLYYWKNLELVDRSNNFNPVDEHISYTVSSEKRGRYYIRVYPYEGACSSSPYTLRIEYTPSMGNR